MAKLFTYSIIFIALFCKCSEQKSSEGLINKHFTKSEIIELDKLSKFFIEQVSSSCDVNRRDCLSLYFSKFKDLPASATTLDLMISQELESQLLTNIDQSVFNHIWTTCINQRILNKDSVVNVQTICINQNGKFSKFLTEVIREHSSLKIYGKPFAIGAGYTASMNAILLKQPERFDFDSETEMLIVAIHILTLNYPEKII